MALPARTARHTSLLALLLPATLIVASACGGPSTTTTTPTAVVSATVSAPVPEDAPPDMSPVAKPANVFLTARLASVSASIETIDKLLKLPKPLKGQLDAQIERKGASFVDLTATIDVGLALDPAARDENAKPLFAVSVPIKSTDDAIAAAKKLGADVSGSGAGAYHVRGKGFVCDLGPALGEPQYRAVCSEREAGLETIGPWLVRGLAAEAKPTADGWVRLDVTPFTSKFLSAFTDEADDVAAKLTKEISRALPKADKEVLEIPMVLEGEVIALANDLDYVTGSLKIDAAKPGVDLGLEAHFKSKKSWIAGLVDEAVMSSTTPPELFYRLPKDATTAFYGHSADPAKFTGIRRVARKGIEAVLDVAGGKLKLSDADKKAVLAWVDGFPTISGNWVSASGHATQKAIPEKDLTAQQAIDGFKSEVQGILPWSITGGDGDPAQSIAWLKLTEDVINTAVADVKTLAGNNASKLTFLPVAKVTANPAGYPKGSSELTVTVSVTSKMIWEFLPQNRGVDHPKGAEAKGDVVLHVVVAPDDAGHFWWGYAFDGDALKSHVNAALKGGAATGQLGARTDIEPLKTHKGFGGFISIGGMLDALAPVVERRLGDNMKQSLAIVPHKFAGNVFILGSGSGGAAPTITISASLGKDWVEDLAALFQAISK